MNKHETLHSMGICNKANKNIDEFGGLPFQIHMGSICHRGVRQFKCSNFHPSETTKRVIYQEDGSGRDSYITTNNGGFGAVNERHLHGSGVLNQFSKGLRGY